MENAVRDYSTTYGEVNVSVCVEAKGDYSVFHNECPKFKTLYFYNHETQMNETCTT
jgi:hypothetical protein